MKKYLIFILLPSCINGMQKKSEWDNSCEQQCLWNTTGCLSCSAVAYFYYQLASGGLTKEVPVPCLGEDVTGEVQEIPAYTKPAVIGGFAYTIRRMYGVAHDASRMHDSSWGEVSQMLCGCDHSYFWDKYCDNGKEKKEQ